ncbi:hypothetical protein AV903_23005 [Erwinia tracheiphila]|uniref:Uncharacterized protein n=1 Tax=Erwinia tracheiphila TaxID=65700 RepID=A0A345CXQ7_9GAMM|nr:hypothetical protein AV903_23005 [Erwinia tracheiphila]
MSPENATELKERLQAAFDKAITLPSAENFSKYNLLQDFWAEKSLQFAPPSKEALLKFPELGLQPALQSLQRNGKYPPGDTALAGKRRH